MGNDCQSFKTVRHNSNLIIPSKYPSVTVISVDKLYYRIVSSFWHRMWIYFHIHLKPSCPLSFRAHVIKSAVTLSVVNLDVDCTNHLLFHRGKQWELGQVLLQFMCMSMTPHRSMCTWRAKEWVLPGLLRLKVFFIYKIHHVICFYVCNHSLLSNEHLLTIFAFRNQCSYYA